MAVGKGSILRASNANAATKEKAAVKENVSEVKDNVSAPQVVKDADLAAKVPVDALKPVPKSWGIPVLNEARITQLENSMKEFGILVPVLVYKNKKQELMVLKGNHRIAAAKNVGIKEVPVAFVEADSDAGAKNVYSQIRVFDKTEEMKKEYEVVSSIAVNMPSYLL